MRNIDSATNRTAKGLTAGALLAILLFAAGCPSPRVSEKSGFMARVETVADGDSFTVERNGEKVRIRINLIDAPELHQEFGPESREHLISLIGGQRVLIEPVDRDRYGRTVADVFVDNRNLGLAQIYDGYAWYFRVRNLRRSEYEAAEQQAKVRRAGLWGSGDPTPPWEWRKENPRTGN